MRFLFIAQDIGSGEMGMGYRSYNFAKELAKKGHEVLLVTASYSHVRRSNPRVKGLFDLQQIEGMNYQFIKCFNFGNSLFWRALNMLYFSILLYLFSNRISRIFNADIVIASSPQPFVFYAAEKIKNACGSLLVFEVRDLWPLSLTETGKVNPNHPFIKLLSFTERYAYKRADLVVSLLKNSEKYMIKKGLSPQKFMYLPNGVTDPILSNSDLDILTLDKIKLFKKQYPFLVGYTGAHGIMNHLDFIIQICPKLEKDGIGLLLVGNGPEKSKLIKLSKNFKNILFLDPVPKDQIPSILKHVDLAYIGLLPSTLFNYGISPNKLIDYMLAAKPIVMAINSPGNLVEESKCGMQVEPNNSEQLYSAIKDLSKLSQQDLVSMGQLGNQYILKNLMQKEMISSFLNKISEMKR